MTIEIKTYDGRVLYTATTATNMKSALTEAVLRGADLEGADLQGADLRGADLEGAYLRDAYLQGADLRGADLQGAYLRGADLRGADLEGAYLRGADLRGAYLQGAYLRGAKNAELAIAKTRIIPDEGSYIGWKKVTGNCVAKLRIPGKAKRSHASGRKCRASQAKVLAIFNIETGEAVAEAYSLRDHTFAYRVGETVLPREPFDDDMWNECASGIHHYISRIEAENHV